MKFIKTSWKILHSVRLSLAITICCGALASSPSVFANATPPPAPLPSLLMGGTGQITPSTNQCVSATCTGTFTATLTGRPFGKIELTLNLSVDAAADAFTGCHQVTGVSGLTANAYNVNLVGQLCTPGIGYSLSGTVEIYSAGAAIGTGAVGTLLAFGGTNIPPDPIPNSGPSVVSIVGASGTIPLLLP